jgi:pimeloyl-ACP methyl ester carboxylesterase
VALELLGRGGASGAVLCGAPPATHDLAAFAGAFAPHPCLALFAKQTLTPAEQGALARAAYGEKPPAFAAAALARADGRARVRLFDSLHEGLFLDGRATMVAAGEQVTAIDGADDPFLAGGEAAGPGPLPRGRHVRLAGCGHAAFRDAPAAFDRLVLQAFSRTAGRGAPRHARPPLAPRRAVGF